MAKLNFAFMLTVLLCLVLKLGLLSAYELLPYDPVANPNAIVHSGNARFTILTPQLIRMEYSSSGVFEDSRTVAFLNRNLSVPYFQLQNSSESLTITTSSLRLSYMNGQPFSPSSLSVVSVDNSSAFQSWTYGEADVGNLLGTFRTLDGTAVVSLNCTVYAQQTGNPESESHCTWGLISSAGWVVVNDTAQPIMDSTDWWSGTNSDDEDLYLFAHGHNYKQALFDFTQVAGKVAMTPRYAMGPYFTRWYDYANVDVRKIVKDYESRDLPLDVLVLDMNWHLKNDWTGYTFDPRLYPFPSDTLSWLSLQGLHMAANLHDSSGVINFEKMYTQFADWMGVDPSSVSGIPFQPLNKTYMFGLEDIVLGDVEKQGMNFWWIDWQQGETGGGCAGGAQNPTYITNHVRSTDHIRRGENIRGLILARFGGLGSHRYQVGFSGDVNGLTWQNLAFQPYFSLTANNVAFGYWSHDLEGPSNDYEMYVRWVQWVAYSGVLRSHERGMSAGSCADDSPPDCSIVQVWDVPTLYFEANRDALQAREKLIPYIYTCMRSAFDTGLALLRPMYYEYPELSMAYAASNDGSFAQYMYGEHLMVAPVVMQSNSNTSMAEISIWIPPGSWVEQDTGYIYTGNSDGSTILTKSFDLSEVPVFARAGAIISYRPLTNVSLIGLAQQPYTTLGFQVFPGAPSYSTAVYEDDGISMGYLTGQYAWINVSYTREPLLFTFMASTQGTFPAQPSARSYEIQIMSSIPPTKVVVNGANLPYQRFGGASSWSYDGNTLSTIIECGPIATGTPLNVEVYTTIPFNDTLMSGIKGGILHSILAKRNLDQSRDTPGSTTTYGEYLLMASSTGDALSYLAGNDLTAFMTQVEQYPTVVAGAYQEVKALIHDGPQDGALEQLYDSDREDSVLCGSVDCVNSNNYYQWMRTEGYMPLSGDPSVIPFYDCWSSDHNDNWATTDPNCASDYSSAVFANGFVFSEQLPGTIPLQLWFNSERWDHLTVASEEGIQYAQQNGYTLLNGTLGYCYENKPSLRDPSPTRVAYSLELLASTLLIPDV